MIKGSRITLIPLDLEHLTMLKDDRMGLEKALGLTPYPKTIGVDMERELQQAMEFWIKSVGQHPDHFKWYTNWEIILEEENRSVGGIGLGGEPNDRGETMVGYYIDLHYRNKGIASESLEVLSNWAFQHASLQRIMAETPHDNHASRKVLKKNGFRIISVKPITYIWSLEREKFLAQ